MVDFRDVCASWRSNIALDISDLCIENGEYIHGAHGCLVHDRQAVIPAFICDNSLQSPESVVQKQGLLAVQVGAKVV